MAGKKIDFRVKLKDLEGNLIPWDKRNGEATVKSQLTLAEYARTSLNYKVPGQDLTVEENGKRYDILKKVLNKDQPQEFSAEEIVAIKQAALKVNWNTEYEGAANELLG